MYIPHAASGFKILGWIFLHAGREHWSGLRPSNASVNFWAVSANLGQYGFFHRSLNVFNMRPCTVREDVREYGSRSWGVAGFKSIGSSPRQKLRKILALNKESFPRQAHFVLGDRSKQELDFGCLFGYHIQIFKGCNFCISAYESTVKTLSLTRTGILW